MGDPRGRLARIAAAVGFLLLVLVLLLIVLRARRDGHAPATAPASTADEAGRLEQKIATLRVENDRLREEIRGFRTPAPPAAPPVPGPSFRFGEAPEGMTSGRLRVRVTGPDGRPAAGATVRTWRHSGPPGFQVVDRREERTDESGVAELADLPPARTYVSARVDGRSRSIQVPVEAGKLTEVSLPIAGGIVVEGRVRRADGSVVADIRVSLYRRTVGSESQQATTDGAGRYRFEGVSPGRHGVRLYGRGYLPSFHHPWREIVVPAEGPFEHDFVVEVPSIHGRVTDAETGRPVRGAVIGAGQFSVPRTESDEDGRYRFIDLPPRRWFLRVQVNGYAKAATVVTVDESEEGTRYDFALHRPVRVLLTVSDGAGRPYVGKLSVSWSPVGASFSLGEAVTTDEEGRATLSMLGPGRYRLWFRREGEPAVIKTVELLPGGDLEIAIP